MFQMCLSANIYEYTSMEVRYRHKTLKVTIFHILWMVLIFRFSSDKEGIVESNKKALTGFNVPCLNLTMD